MIEAELIAACLPCRYCGQKCFAELSDGTYGRPRAGGIWCAERLSTDIDLAMFFAKFDDKPECMGASRTCRIVPTCDESDNDDFNIPEFAPPDMAVAEWNERFGRNG